MLEAEAKVSIVVAMDRNAPFLFSGSQYLITQNKRGPIRAI